MTGLAYVVPKAATRERNPVGNILFTLVIVFISLVVLLVCVVAIIMSTTHGSARLQGLWQRTEGTRGSDDTGD